MLDQGKTFVRTTLENRSLRRRDLDRRPYTRQRHLDLRAHRAGCLNVRGGNRPVRCIVGERSLPNRTRIDRRKCCTRPFGESFRGNGGATNHLVEGRTAGRPP
jgi:hypothetical protein